MNLGNELVNRLIRLGESQTSFSLQPKIAAIIGPTGRLQQLGARVPLLDVIRVLVCCANKLSTGSVHPESLTGVALGRDLVEALVVSLERVEEPQPDMYEPEPEREKIAGEVRNAKAAYDVASEIMRDGADDPGYTMDRYVKQLNRSPNTFLSQHLLASSGPGNGGWISNEGTLAPLTQPFPRTLAPTRHLELRCRVFDVNESQGSALVEIIDYRRAYDRKMLMHHTACVRLAFDVDSIEREDLLAVQYHQRPAWIRVSAVCGTALRHANHTRLTLASVMMDRSALDDWHTQARQRGLPFDNVSTTDSNL